MKKRILCVLILAICTVSFLTSANISSPAATVKLIRNKIITTTELDKNVTDYQAQGVNVTPLQVLNAMINAELFSQGAEKEGFVLTEEQVDSLVNASKQNVESQLGSTVTDAQFTQIIVQQTGLNMADFRQYLSEQYIRQQYVSSKKPEMLKNLPAPTNKEIESFYKQNVKQFFNPEAIKLSHIFIPLKANDDATNNTNKAKMEDIYSQIVSGKLTFEKAVNLYSEDSDSSNKGGDIGWLAIDSTTDRQNMGDEFFDKAFDLDAGEISDVVTSNYGYHIIKVTVHSQPKILTLTDKISPDQNTTVKSYITSYLSNQKLEAAFVSAYNSLIVDLKNEASIKILYKES
ncbi:MAG: peptidylprolyl isomerase [Sphaerochaetaceae bacterium]